MLKDLLIFSSESNPALNSDCTLLFPTGEASAGTLSFLDQARMRVPRAPTLSPSPEGWAPPAALSTREESPRFL